MIYFRAEGLWLDNRWTVVPENRRARIRNRVTIRAERVTPLDPQSLVAHSVGVLIGNPPSSRVSYLLSADSEYLRLDA